MFHLLDDVKKMGLLVKTSVQNASRSLLEDNTLLAESIIKDDKKLNHLEILIHDQAMKIIATEQPVAGDLRRIVSAVHISSELERMGDHAVHLAKAQRKLQNQTLLKELIDISKLCTITTTMITQVMKAYIDIDESQARTIARLDDQIDEMHYSAIREVMATMAKDPSCIKHASNILLINWYFERLGDHVTNICEWICFTNSGEHQELNL